MIEKTYDAGDIAHDFVVNLEDTLFKCKSRWSGYNVNDADLFSISTVALVDLLGQHLATNRELATDDYMMKVHKKLCDMIEVPKPTLRLVGKEEVADLIA